MPDGSINMEVITLAADLKRAADDVKKTAETTFTELKNLGKVTDETKANADQALILHTELSAKHTDLVTRIDELERRVTRKPGRMLEDDRPKSLGQLVVEDEGIKTLLANGRGKADVKVKAIISSLTTDANGSAGDLIVPDRRPGILGLPEIRLTVRDLLMPGSTTSTSIQYVKETGFTSNAASVSETSGATKPQSEIKFDIATTAVTTLAHWVLATKQILSDVPQLQSYIEGRLRYGLALEEEDQLLNGAGSGTDLNGIIPQATAYSAPFTLTGATMIDKLRLGMLQASLAEYPATGIVLHPSDWTNIELTKTDDGAYLFASPTAIQPARIWGLPVVTTTAMTIDKFLVGAFKLGAQIFDRWDATVLISTEDSDNFRKNLVTILAEQRLALAVYRPEAFYYGDFGNV